MSDQTRAIRRSTGAADDRMRAGVLRVLLRTFIVLTLIVAAISVAERSWLRLAVSGAGVLVYTLLLLGIPRFGPARIGFVLVIWYFVLATAAMASGRGVNDVTIVLLPAGMFLGALLLDRALLVPLVGVSVIAATAVGLAKIKGLLGPPTVPGADVAEVMVAALMLIVAGLVSHLVVRSLFSAISERRRAEESLRQNARELEARNEALQLVNELAHRLSPDLGIDEIARETVHVLIQHSHPPFVAFYLLSDDGTRLRLLADEGFTEEERAIGLELPFEGSFGGAAIKARQLIWTHDIPGESRAYARTRAALASRGVGSALTIPLHSGDTAFGNVTLVFQQRREFSPLDLDTYAAIGRTVSLSIANSRHVAGLDHQVHHDALTSLPNRQSLHRDFARTASGGDGRTALMLIDLNRFREINEALGHHVGDELLLNFGARLRAQAGGDGATVFRLGGDEFVVLLPEVDDARKASRRAEELLRSIRRPFTVDGMALEVTASAGIAMYPDDGSSSHDLLRCADVALYHAKRTAATVALYSREFDEHTPERLALLAELSDGIPRGELRLHYQPQVALDSGTVVGVEALVRWAHPKHGLLFPARFLPFAEASEVIHPLTYRVVRDALVQLRDWRRSADGVGMAINLSVRNLLDSSCADRLTDIMNEVEIDPARVEFELTETALMSDPVAAVEMLGRIASSGARLAIDDFGTGYSSLSYLRRFPLYALKIDRSFVADMLNDRQNHSIVESTVQLARGLELHAVAEGVEDQLTVDALRRLGCEQAQGYYFGRPIAGDEMGMRLGSQGGWKFDTTTRSVAT